MLNATVINRCRCAVAGSTWVFGGRRPLPELPWLIDLVEYVWKYVHDIGFAGIPAEAVWIDITITKTGMTFTVETLTKPLHCCKNGWGWLRLGTVNEAKLPSYAQHRRYGSSGICDFTKSAFEKPISSRPSA